MPGRFSSNNLRVRMGGVDLNGRISGSQVFSTSVTPPASAPVVGELSFSNIEDNSITVRWSLTGSVPTSTVIEFGTSTAYGTSVELDNPESTAVTLTPLAANTEYFFRVTATNSAGSGSSTGSQSTAMVPEYTISGNITDSVSNASVTPSTYTVQGVAGATRTIEIRVTANSGYRFLSGDDITFSGLGSSLELLNTNLDDTETVSAQIRATIGSSNMTDNFSVNGSASLDVAAPQVTTNEASNITTTSMVLNGRVDDDGGAMITNRFFEWGPTSALGNTVDGIGNVTFLASIRELTPGRDYHFRAGATNSSGLTGYGDVEVQSTLALQVPRVVTLAPQDLEQTTVTFIGQQTDTGGAAVTERGFYYRTGSGQTLDPDNLTPWTKVTDDSTTGGIISEGVTGLTADTAYTYVAFATNSVGTGFGGSRSFTTREPIVLPSISSFTATADGQNAVNLAWTATDADRFELDYGLDRMYGTMVTVEPTDRSARVTGLQAGFRYFFRLRAFNDDGSDFAIDDVTTAPAFVDATSGSFTGEALFDINQGLQTQTVTVDVSPSNGRWNITGASSPITVSPSRGTGDTSVTITYSGFGDPTGQTLILRAGNSSSGTQLDTLAIEEDI